MTLEIAAELDLIRHETESGNYAEAIRRIQCVQPRLLDTAEQRSLLYYYWAKALYHLGDYSRALHRIRTSLRYARMLATHSLYASEKLLAGVIKHALGDLDGAIEEYLDSHAARKRAGEYHAMYGAYVNLGLVHMLKGDLLRAQECFTKSLQLAATHNTEDERNICRLNLARANWLLGDFHAAQATLSSIERSTSQKITGIKAAKISGIIDAYLLSYGSSLNALAGCLRSFSAKHFTREIAVCLEYLGLNEYFAGNFKKAREYYDQVLAMPEPTASAVAQTLRMLTDVEIAEGNWEQARTTAAKADTAITKISERIELGALWRAYGQIAAHDGNFASAAEWFAKSTDLLRQLGARYELALTYLEIGKCASLDHSQRLEGYKQARQLFVDMEVPKRIEQVDAELAQLKQTSSIKFVSKGNHAVTGIQAVPKIVAASAQMREIVALADTIKDSELTVLITGETGTGKDLLAEYIHYSSQRGELKMGIVNCAALPELLIESELFGAVRGAYSGATKDNQGMIAAASGSTFCFDEIGDLPLGLQAKILRAIDTKTVRCVGSHEDRTIDVRFIALTNRNLDALVASGEFRADLYHRFKQIPIHLPPLRERLADIVPLFATFAAEHRLAIDLQNSELCQLLCSYSWPGNVREMQSLVRRMAAKSHGNNESAIIALLRSELGFGEDNSDERRRLHEVLLRNGGNRSKAADELGIPRTTFISQLQKYDL